MTKFSCATWWPEWVTHWVNKCVGSDGAQSEDRSAGRLVDYPKPSIWVYEVSFYQLWWTWSGQGILRICLGDPKVRWKGFRHTPTVCRTSILKESLLKTPSLQKSCTKDYKGQCGCKQDLSLWLTVWLFQLRGYSCVTQVVSTVWEPDLKNCLKWCSVCDSYLESVTDNCAFVVSSMFVPIVILWFNCETWGGALWRGDPDSNSKPNQALLAGRRPPLIVRHPSTPRPLPSCHPKTSPNRPH